MNRGAGRSGTLIFLAMTRRLTWIRNKKRNFCTWGPLAAPKSSSRLASCGEAGGRGPIVSGLLAFCCGVNGGFGIGGFLAGASKTLHSSREPRGSAYSEAPPRALGALHLLAHGLCFGLGSFGWNISVLSVPTMAAPAAQAPTYSQGFKCGQTSETHASQEPDDSHQRPKSSSNHQEVDRS